MIQADQPTIFDRAKILAVVSDKQDGNVKYEQGEDADKNIRGLLERIGLRPEQLAIMYVNDSESWDSIHEVTAAEVGDDSLNPNQRIHADALVTAKKHIALFLPTADCNPVIIHDPVNNVLALVHLGWQSTEADLAYKVVQYLQKKHNSNPKDLLVYCGPAIKAESYVFADEPKQAQDPAWQPYLHKNVSGTGIDLIGFVINRLQAAGVSREHIEKSPVNTAISGSYFSHYRAVRNNDVSDDGRFATICMLR